MATALRAIQRQIVRLGLASGTPEAALSLARQLAMTTYRGEGEFGLRFDAAPAWCDGRFQFPVERYLAAAGRKFVARFDPERFLALSESIDLHRIEPEAVSVPTTAIAITSDRLVPLADLIELSKRMAGACRLETLDSRYGHDAFLKEPERIGALVEIALNARCNGVAA
jgi:homoserine O-acetyltransferase